ILNGTMGDLLNVNPGSTWFLFVSGTSNANYANLGNADGSGSASQGVAINSTNSGSNVNWTFGKYWDNGGGDFLWSNPNNWTGDQLPTNGETVVFDALYSVANVTLDMKDTVAEVSMAANYTGTFTF